MRDDQGESALWQACPRGTLAGLAGRLRSRHRRRLFARLAVAPLVLLAAGTAAVAMLGNNAAPPSETSPPTGSVAIKCKECKQLLSQYLVHALPPDQMEKMRVHLAKCRPCREAMEQMRSSVASLDHECSDADCPLCRARRTVGGTFLAHAAPLESHFHVARLELVRDPQ